jgi:hypothetical protein
VGDNFIKNVAIIIPKNADISNFRDKEFKNQNWDTSRIANGFREVS